MRSNCGAAAGQSPEAARRAEDDCLRRRRKRGGFTLVELLVVLAILGAIAAIVTPQVFKYLGKARSDAAGVAIERLAGVLDLYRIELGDYPDDSSGLDALLEAPPGAEQWNGPYVSKAEQLKDPWGRRYRYRFPGEHGEYDLYTLGKDDQEGGKGEDRDITSW